MFEPGCYFDTARPLDVKAKFLVAPMNIRNGFECAQSRNSARSPSLGRLGDVAFAVMLLIEIVQLNVNIIWKRCAETRGQCIEVECCVRGNVEV